MKPFLFLAVTVLAIGGMMPSVAMGDPRVDQKQAIAGVGKGRLLKLEVIEAMVLPTIRGMQYLGPELDSEMLVYRLKFIRDGHVVFVDVDGRTGRVIGQSR